MLRFFLFFALAVVLTRVLAHLPLVGGLFAHTGIFGIWIVAILLSWGATWWGERAVRVQRSRSELRRLLQVDTPHNHGKAGSLLLASGRARAALEHLEAAAAGEPDRAEWHYRLGMAQLQLARLDEAAVALERAVALDPEHGYGAAQMRLAEVRAERDDPEGAVQALRTFERTTAPARSPRIAWAARWPSWSATRRRARRWTKWRTWPPAPRPTSAARRAAGH